MYCHRNGSPASAGKNQQANGKGNETLQILSAFLSAPGGVGALTLASAFCLLREASWGMSGMQRPVPALCAYAATTQPGRF